MSLIIKKKWNKVKTTVMWLLLFPILLCAQFEKINKYSNYIVIIFFLIISYSTDISVDQLITVLHISWIIKNSFDSPRIYTIISRYSYHNCNMVYHTIYILVVNTYNWCHYSYHYSYHEDGFFCQYASSRHSHAAHARE